MNEKVEIINEEKVVGTRSRLIAILLGVLLMGLGIHAFYLGHTKRGVTILLWTILGSLILIGPFVSLVLTIIDIIQIADKDYVDADGKLLKD